MTPINLFKNELAKIGYSEIEGDYIFSDVFAPEPLNRTAPLAAFTHSPPSYRSAALAVVESNRAETAEVASNYRALGAPLIFVVEGKEVSIWQAHPHSRPTLYRQRTKLDQLEILFFQNKELWNPQRIHRAKSFGSLNLSYQLDFVDTGLL